MLRKLMFAAALLIVAASSVSAQSSGGPGSFFGGGSGFGRTVLPPCVPVRWRNPDGRVVGGCTYELAGRRNVEVLPGRLKRTQAGWRWQ